MNPKNSRGFTLIEMMVAIVIGSALMIALTEVFKSGNVAYSVQDRVGEMQESGRYAMYFLQRDVRLAGYPGTATSPINPFVTGTGFTSEGSGNNSDTISIQYRPDQTDAQDCVGNYATGSTLVGGVHIGGTITDTYAVSNDPTTGLSRLTCNGQPIVEGIQSMQVQYGIDTDTDVNNSSYGYAEYFVPANSVALTAEVWSLHVVAVRISLLATTVTPVFGDKPADTTATYVLLDAPPIGPLATGIRGKVYSATIELRNRST